MNFRVKKKTSFTKKEKKKGSKKKMKMLGKNNYHRSAYAHRQWSFDTGNFDQTAVFYTVPTWFSVMEAQFNITKTAQTKNYHIIPSLQIL